jgi:hypothetical protein
VEAIMGWNIVRMRGMPPTVLDYQSAEDILLSVGL